MTVEPRAVDLHCFDADPEPDPDPAQNLDADPDPDPGGGGWSAKNVHPPGKIIGTPLPVRSVSDPDSYLSLGLYKGHPNYR